MVLMSINRVCECAENLSIMAKTLRMWSEENRLKVAEKSFI